MSEYINVERPFLDKLRQIGWEVINHNEKQSQREWDNTPSEIIAAFKDPSVYYGIPQDPSISLR